METEESLRKYCTDKGRVCPMPIYWDEMHSMLKAQRVTYSGGTIPPRPLILAAWGESKHAKSERLMIHIRWARKHKQLDEIGSYLRNLKEEDWLHIND